jgi:hypothetical protein
VTSAFERLAGAGNILRAEPPDAGEFARLISSGRAQLADARNATVSLQVRFLAAYGGAHALCLAALRYRGYRPQNRYIVFQLLPETLGVGPEVWRVLAKAHGIRNVAEYEGDFAVDERLVADVLVAAELTLARLEALPSI